MENHIGLHYQTVEKAIKLTQHDPIKARGETGNWKLDANGTPIWIQVKYFPNVQGYYFQVAAPVVKTPTENTGAFCLQLLRLNVEMFGVSFKEKNGMVYLSSIREVQDLDVSEAFSTINKVANYADYYNQSKKKGLLNWTYFKVGGPDAPSQVSLK